jgi:hypothetical protein
MGERYSQALSVQVWLGNVSSLTAIELQPQQQYSCVGPLIGESRTAHLEKVLQHWTSIYRYGHSPPEQRDYAYGHTLERYIFCNPY